ncbi:MAG: STN domain-containing protein [Phycisphaerae bacterium]|nr:STN domain-containing protein [Tepidisphaeraceae bacterium]
MKLIAPLLVIALALLPAVAPAQPTESSALINQALDRQTKLNFTGTLPEAMQYIAKETGVPIEADPAVWELLPWGKDTEVRAKIENQTLREALTAITRTLGLTFVLRTEAIELTPQPALRRLGEKSTLSELQLLDALAKTKLDFKGGDKAKLKDVVEAIDQKLAGLAGSSFQVVNRSSTSDRVPQDSAVAVGRTATLLEALDAIAGQTPATWFPRGRDVVILSKQDQTARLLGKQVSLEYDGAPVEKVLEALSARSGVKFTYEPGSVMSIPPQLRNIRMVVKRTTVEEALGVISSVTGLGYVVREDEVYVWNASVAPGGQPRERAIGWFQTDTGLNVMVREGEVPADIREFIEFQKKRQIDAWRKMMIEQGFKPSPAATSATSGGGTPGNTVRPPEKPQPPAPAPNPGAPKEPGKDL